MIALGCHICFCDPKGNGLLFMQLSISSHSTHTHKRRSVFSISYINYVLGTSHSLSSLALPSSSDNQYLGFGLSGRTDQTQMFGADTTITWVDDETGPHAEDYFLSGYFQVRS